MSKTMVVYGRSLVCPAPRPPSLRLRPLSIQVTPSLCHGSADILYLQRPGRWPPGKVGEGSRCHPR